MRLCKAPQSAVLAALAISTASALVTPSQGDTLGLAERDLVSRAAHPHEHSNPGKKDGKKSKRPTARDFYVNGKSIPGVPFAVSDSYAGLLPISSKASESRKLFWWYYPTETGTGDDSLVIWLNGGPGCSSLEGLLQENGPFLLPWNTTEVVKNKLSFHKLANTLWIEQPVSTGLGEGTADITNERQLAEQFYGFLVNFFATFPKLKGKKLYLTGESYAGKYIPYIADHMLSRVSKAENKRNGINFHGIQINDPSWISDTLSENLPAVEFAEHFQRELNFNQSTIDSLRKTASDAGVLDYVAKNLNYPPKGALTTPNTYNASTYSTFNDMVNAAIGENPCFNIYNVDPIYRCPSVTDPLGYPPDALDPSPNNFVNNVTGFKEYIHADPDKTWLECVDGVFRGKRGDTSPDPLSAGIMQRIIENAPSKRTVIQHGILDAILIANGTALGIQNMTFNGQRGFQRRPSRQLIVDGQEKGLVHTERGLTYLEASGSGHMIPQDQPATAYKMLQFLLGQISSSDLYRN